MAVQHKYTAGQISEFRAQFNAFDKDASGSISADEMKLVLRNVGLEVGDDVASSLISEYDTNGDGDIGFREFLNMMWKLQTGTAKVPAAAGSSSAPAPQPTHFYAWGPADVYTVLSVSNKTFVAVRGAGGVAEAPVVCADADNSAVDVPFRIHCRKDELMFQCYTNGLFLTALKDGSGVLGVKEPVPGLSEWRFKRLGGAKFSLQNVALGTFLEYAADTGVAGGATLRLAAVHGSARVDPAQKWRINEIALPTASK